MPAFNNNFCFAVLSQSQSGLSGWNYFTAYNSQARARDKHSMTKYRKLCIMLHYGFTI